MPRPLGGRPPDGPHAAVAVPCPLLVGRGRERDLLVSALEDARRGRGSVVFVVGEAGIGKSRLVREAALAAAQHGMRTLRGRAVPGSGATAFRPLAEALAAVATEAAAEEGLGSWLPALGAVLPTVAPDGAVEATAPVRGEAVLRLLAAVCATSGGLVVLEDLHWADPETVAVVEHLSDNLHRAPVLCVVTIRDEESPARDLLRRVRSGRTAQVLELERLDDAEVAAMVHGCLGGQGPADLERVVSMAEGVPFLVEEVLVSPGLPATFAEGVQARLTELGESDRRVLVAAAAFGRHFDWRLSSAASGVDEADVVEALERGVAAQLLTVEGDGFRFRHALTAEAVFRSVVPPRRQAVAATALAALDGAHPQLPAEQREVAAHLAERAGDRGRAGRLHIELGVEAIGRGALHTGVTALRHAAELLPAGEEQDEAHERLVEALVLAGHVDEALALGRSLTSRLPPARAAAVHLRLAGAAATAARWQVAEEHLAAASSSAPSSPRAVAELALREAEVALGTDDTDRAEQRARAALGTARAAGLHDQECEALQLLGRGARRSSLEVAQRWFRDALAAAEAHDLAFWRLRALHELGTIDLLEHSDVDALVEAQRLAEAVGAMATATVLDIEIAAGYAGADDLDAVVRHGEQAVRRGGELGLGLIVAWGWQHLAAIAAVRGDERWAAEARAAAQAAAPGNRDIEGFLVGGQLLGALAHDDLERALGLASRMTEILRGSATAPPAHHRAAWPVLLALAGRPEAEDAIGEVEAAGVAVSRSGRAWLALARAILAGRTDGATAAALAREADASLGHTPMWQSLGRRLTAQGAAADGWEVPDSWLVEAESCLRRLGLTAVADTCRRLRGAAPSGLPPSWARLGITRREADVLALVIEGLSNREIGERLHLSVRTVEKHVEALLRKTLTKSRTQLVRAAPPT